MDTQRDFLFLNERIATEFNPFYEDEYLVIQTYPREKSLRVSKRYFSYRDAKQYCELENMAHDYTSFGVRIIHNQKLWNLDFCGHPSQISKQQDWKIAEIYLQAHDDTDTHEEIIVCSCSYPYFYALKRRVDQYGSLREYWQNVTCLVDDKGRDIECCQNCNSRLIEGDDLDEDFDDEEPRPAACIGCSNYHGVEYGGNLLVCGMYPLGWDGENCPEFINS
jgi:hypothetical protein